MQMSQEELAELQSAAAEALRQTCEIWRGTVTTSASGAAERGTKSKVATIPCLVVTRSLPERAMMAGATPATSTPCVLMLTTVDVRAGDELLIESIRYAVGMSTKRSVDILQRVSVTTL